MFRSWNGDFFDDIVLSYKVALVKPDERVYQLAAQRLGVVPDECVYIDDMQANVDGAAEVGMRTILYQNVESFTQQLEESLRETTSQKAQS